MTTIYRCSSYCWRVHEIVEGFYMCFRWVKWIGFSLLALALSGCVSSSKSVSKDFQHVWKPAQVLESRTHIQQPLFKADGSYSLAALLELGISQNPRTRTAWWQARKALAQEGRTESQFFPKITANVGVNRDQTGAVLGKSSTKMDHWGPSLNIAYRLFQFGAGVADAKSAACALAAANYNFNYALQTLVFDIQKNYYNYASSVATIEACESSLKDAEASFDAVLNKQSHGLARIQDVLLAKADKLQAEYELKSAQADLEKNRSELALSVGVPVSKDFLVKVEFKDSEPLTEEVENLLSDALKRRSDVLSAESSVHAADWAHLKTQREGLPEVNFTGSVGTQRYRKDSHWQRNYSLGLGVSWSIFEGFDSQYKALESYSNLKAKTYELHQKQLQALSDVWAEFHAFQSAIRLLSSAKALEAAAQESLEAIRLGYDAGLNSLLDLLSAQKTLSAARLKRINSQSSLAIHWVQLAYVSGRLDPNHF